MALPVLRSVDGARVALLRALAEHSAVVEANRGRKRAARPLDSRGEGRRSKPGVASFSVSALTEGTTASSTHSARPRPAKSRLRSPAWTKNGTLWVALRSRSSRLMSRAANSMCYGRGRVSVSGKALRAIRVVPSQSGRLQCASGRSFWFRAGTSLSAVRAPRDDPRHDRRGPGTSGFTNGELSVGTFPVKAHMPTLARTRPGGRSGRRL